MADRLGIDSVSADAPFDGHGIEPVPAAARDSRPLDQFWIWMGANINPINWLLGTLGITLGLSLLETIVVIALGNAAGCALFGLFCVMGHRTGVNQMVLARAAFGRRGGYGPAAVQLLLTMGWVGVNTWVVLDLTIALLGKIGITGGDELKYIVAFGLMASQVAIATWGFYAIRTFERWTVPVTALVMAVMTVVALTQVNVELTGGSLSGGARITAITQLVTAIGIGWGISWLVYASDYTRFSTPGSSDRSVFWATFAGMFLPTVWLGSLGAAIASGGVQGDPSEIVIAAFGVMAVPVLLLVLHGPVATNILNLYSCGLAAPSLGLRVTRWKVTLTGGLVGSAVLVVFVESSSFATSFQSWMASLIVWISPFAGITLIDFFFFRRGRLDVGELYVPTSRSLLADINMRAVVAMALGLLAGWSWQYGLVDVLQGPLAKALGDTDLSWLTGMLVGGGTYFLLERRSRRRGLDVPVMSAPGQPARVDELVAR